MFLTSVEGAMKETIHITALGLEDGAERWRRTFEAAEEFEWNDYVSKGAPTPAVDAERLYAFFASGDLLALTHDGETVWHRKLGRRVRDGGRQPRRRELGAAHRQRRGGDAGPQDYSYLLAVDPATGRTCGRPTVNRGRLEHPGAGAVPATRSW